MLREAAEFLLGDADVDQAVYLGGDDIVDVMVSHWARDIMAGDSGEDAFLTRASALAQKGTAAEIDALLSSDAALRRLSGIRKLPPPPARAIEMIEDRIILMVHDKSILDEEDIANASVIVYGKSDDALLKRFGRRYFFTPGPLARRQVGILELEDDGCIALGLYDPGGAPLWRETLQGRTVKVVVSS